MALEVVVAQFTEIKQTHERSMRSRLVDYLSKRTTIPLLETVVAIVAIMTIITAIAIIATVATLWRTVVPAL